MKDTKNMTKSQAKGYILYLKSYCDAPDFEQEFLADSKEEAANDAYKILDLDYETIYQNMEEI